MNAEFKFWLSRFKQMHPYCSIHSGKLPTTSIVLLFQLTKLNRCYLTISEFRNGECQNTSHYLLTGMNITWKTGDAKCNGSAHVHILRIRLSFTTTMPSIEKDRSIQREHSLQKRRNLGFFNYRSCAILLFSLTLKYYPLNEIHARRFKTNASNARGTTLLLVQAP